MSFEVTPRFEWKGTDRDETIMRQNKKESCTENKREKKKCKFMFMHVYSCLPDVPPMSMALRLRAFIMLTVMVLAVGL